MKSKCYRSSGSITGRVVVPGPIFRRTKLLYPRIVTAMLLVLALALAVCAPATAVMVDGQVLGRTSGTDPVIEPTLEFARDDIVTSDVYLKDAGEGDILEWAFTGPHEMIYNESQSLTTGHSVARTTFDLGLLSTNEAVGLWTLDISLNGVPAVRQDFTVEPLTGLVWWGPFVGAGLLIGLVAIVVILGVLVVAGILVVHRVFRKKKE
jgi:hypothetical protein